jgi:hypothetical protein
MSDIVFLVAYPPSGSGNSMKAQRRKVPTPRAALTVATSRLTRQHVISQKTRLLELPGQESDADKVRRTSEEH